MQVRVIDERRRSERPCCNRTVRDFLDPTPERQNVILIDAATVRKAERLIESCERCDSDVEIPFDNILDRVTGSDPSVTDYNFIVRT